MNNQFSSKAGSRKTFPTADRIDAEADDIVRAATEVHSTPCHCQRSGVAQARTEIEEQGTGERLPNLLSASAKYIESCRNLHHRYIDLIAQAIIVPPLRKAIRTARSSS